jgi:hypothetical protein
VRIREYLLTEARKKFPEFSDLGLKASTYNVRPVDMVRAETIGAMTDLMSMFTKKKVSPISGDKFKIGIKSGNIVVIWTPKGKSMMRTRIESNPGYFDDVLNVFKEAYKNYFERISK